MTVRLGLEHKSRVSTAIHEPWKFLYPYSKEYRSYEYSVRKMFWSVLSLGGSLPSRLKAVGGELSLLNREDEAVGELQARQLLARVRHPSSAPQHRISRPPVFHDLTSYPKNTHSGLSLFSLVVQFAVVTMSGKHPVGSPIGP